MNRLDIEAIRRDFPVAHVVGAVAKLQRVNGELRGCCPFHDDRSPSFYIYEGGKRWFCFGGCGGGDVLDAVQRLYGGSLRDAAERLCGGELPIVATPGVRNKDRTRSLEFAREVWTSAAPIAGTPADAYLRGRGIAIDLPPTLRFARLAPPRDSGVYAANGPGRLAALVALVVDSGGIPTGLQRTYLTERGSKAASTDSRVKFSLGSIRGGAVRLGPAIDDGLALTEGVEDALSLMQLGAPSAWAAAGAGMLDGMKLPSEVQSVVIGGDADTAGRCAADKAAAAFVSAGRRVRIAYPPAPAKDWNEALQAQIRKAA